MKHFLLFAITLISSISWSQEPVYKRVTIGNPDAELVQILDSVGVDMECGAVYRNDSLQLELNEYTLQSLSDAGVKYTVLIVDLTQFYADRAAAELPQAREELEAMKEESRKKKGKSVVKNVGQHDDCEEIDWAVPNNFHLNPNNSPNSFGGCLTYDQVLNELDSMRTLYPNLISLKLDASPTNQTTIEGRTMYYVRISDNPDVDEPNEPETLYQSLIHSREASSIMQLLYFMWYLLENYDTDEAVARLLNNQALYFIPVYNPDGFVYNEIESPDGGGLQRKNRNTEGGCSTFDDGVDLNRNSAYYWGNGGASSNNCSQTYLGSGPFSENETQIMRDFFLLHDFELSLNHHSYKNAMLHGYAGTNITNPRPDEYAKYSHDMSFYNRYAYGPSTSISSLNSGNMNDWMLGGPAGVSSNGTPTGTGSGKNTLAWTPENGNSSEGGFWPSPSNFVPIAKRAVRMNFLAAYYSGKYARLHDLNKTSILNATGDLSFSIENLGQKSSDFTVNVVPLTSNISSVGSAVTESGMTVLEQRIVSINYSVAPGTPVNDTVRFEVTLTNDYASDSIMYVLEIEKIYQPSFLLEDNPDLDGLSNWTANGGTWTVTSDAFSGSSAITFTDQPPYDNNVASTLELNAPLDFSTATQASIQFYAKWDLERSFDYVQLEVSTNGSNWTPMCGQYTKAGASDGNNTYSGKNGASNNFQPDGSPLYDGDTQDKWVMEDIPINAQENAFLLGESTVYLRFHFNSESGNSQDAYYNADFEGFSFDDFTCSVIDDSNASLGENQDLSIVLFPNPADETVTLNFGDLDVYSLQIINVNGQEMCAMNALSESITLATENWATGVYFVRVNDAYVQKFVKR